MELEINQPAFKTKNYYVNFKHEYGFLDTQWGSSVSFYENPEGKGRYARCFGVTPGSPEIAEHMIEVIKGYAKKKWDVDL